jgi:CDP-diacylglycerol--glycerol-3-phosphate 3-phosphatidyltransferase
VATRTQGTNAVPPRGLSTEDIDPVSTTIRVWQVTGPTATVGTSPPGCGKLRHVIGILAVGALALASAALVTAPAFLLGALPVWLVVAATLLWLHARVPAPIGRATQLTLLRGWLIAALAGFILLPPRGWLAWAPGALYTTAAICDLFDGYLARRRDEVTALGGRLDVAMDALGLAVAPLVAVVLGRLPPWYLLLGAAYYLFQAGQWLRRRRGLPLFLDRLRPTPHARMFAGYQMGLVATALFPVVGPPGTAITATLFMLPTLALFGREWLVLTGGLAPDRGTALVAAARRLLATALPVLRVAAAAAIAGLVRRGELAPGLLIASALLAAGVLTRLTAFAAGIAVALILPGRTGLPLLAFLLIMGPLMAGGGRGVLWNPEDRWLFMKAGTPRRAPVRDRAL